jgi:histidinol-phosphatase
MELLLGIAQRAADVADSITTLAFASRNFTVSLKADDSEVTEIDRSAEQAITVSLITATPEFGIFGEEHGASGRPEAEHVWVIDPIDGTTNFVRGLPVWATLIALVSNNVPVLGVVSAPALGFRWWATQGGGAFCNGNLISVSNIAALGDAHISTTPNKGWEDIGALTNLMQLQTSAHRTRGFGDFWQHMLVAQGAIDVAIDAVGLQPYDNAAIYPIVQEAGGKISNRLGVENWQDNSMISTNKLLHELVISTLNQTT